MPGRMTTHQDLSIYLSTVLQFTGSFQKNSIVKWLLTIKVYHSTQITAKIQRSLDDTHLIVDCQIEEYE